LPHSVESQQSPPHVVRPSPSRSSFSSIVPLQLLSTPSEQRAPSSPTGTTWPRHGAHRPVSSQVRVPPLHGPMSRVLAMPS